jgi:tRNA (guanine37-N1)-methyltransferase
MVMKPEPIFAAVETVLGLNELVPPAEACERSESIRAQSERSAQNPKSEIPIILLSPQGRLFDQRVAQDLARYERLALICGRYEGVDERVRLYLATDEVSVGDFVVTGGELPALIVVDAVTRFLPGVLGDPQAAQEDSHTHGLLEYPHYTRPAEFRGYAVPDVLLSGHHAQVARWRREQSLRRTWQRRPDLLAQAQLSQADREFLAGLEGPRGPA